MPKANSAQVYGVQWRSWPTADGRHIDQISQVMDSLRENPDSRRHIVSASNISEIENMALPPCHAFFQFYVADGKLSCQLYQRSADMFFGVPFNIASYALLTRMMADQLGLQPGEFVWTGGDTHIYANHLEQVKEQLTREPYPYPQLRITRTPIQSSTTRSTTSSSRITDTTRRLRPPSPYQQPEFQRRTPRRPPSPNDWA